MDLNSEALSWPVYRLRKTVEHLLFYLEVPDAEITANRDWLTEISANIQHDFQAVYGELTDPAESTRISRLRVDATHFANVLNANPGIRLIQWTESFPDCLPRLRAFQRELATIVAEAAPENGGKKTSEIDSDFTEPLPKEFVAHVFKKSTDWLREQIDGGAIRVHSETSRTARTARFHIDTVPMLKHAHDRSRLLLEFRKKKEQSRSKAD